MVQLIIDNEFKETKITKNRKNEVEVKIRFSSVLNEEEFYMDNKIFKIMLNDELRKYISETFKSELIANEKKIQKKINTLKDECTGNPYVAKINANGYGFTIHFVFRSPSLFKRCFDTCVSKITIDDLLNEISRYKYWKEGK